MSSIYSLTRAGSGKESIKVCSALGPEVLPSGYASFATLEVNRLRCLLAFDKAAQRLDTYALFPQSPWLEGKKLSMRLPDGPWDTIRSFVLGNVCYLLTYRADTGSFGCFAVSPHLELSPPYIFAPSHGTPSSGFTVVEPFTSLGSQYILGYGFETGRVENFSVAVTPSSDEGMPPLVLQNVWYHLWAKGWTHFAFFQLGGSNFFFKINTKKLNVNIDHMQDNPTAGSVEVGTTLQRLLPDALAIDAAAVVPGTDGEPLLVTYVGNTGETALRRIHSNCRGWTLLTSTVTVRGAAALATYRVGESSFLLFYGSNHSP